MHVRLFRCVLCVGYYIPYNVLVMRNTLTTPLVSSVIDICAMVLEPLPSFALPYGYEDPLIPKVFRETTFPPEPYPLIIRKFSLRN
jgi:hypothetical protein